MQRNSEKMYDAIIIGSGAGGLTAGVALSRAKKKVLVLEQHYVPGGWCHSFQLQGQKFSPGVHYIGGLGEGEQLRKTYEGLGLGKELSFFKMVHTGFEHCIIGNKKFDYSSDFNEFREDLINRFPHEKKGLKKYLKIVSKTEKQIIRLSRAEKPLQKLQYILRSGTLIRHGWRNLDKMISKYIKDPDLKAILSIQCGDIGLTPKQANFAYFTAVSGHYASGGYFPMGGGAAIVKSMTNELKRNNGEIRCQSIVEEILIEENKAVGVQLSSGEKITANYVISNADPHVTYGKLIKQNLLSKKLKKKLGGTEYSPSSLMLFVTVDMDVRKHGIDSGNYWISSSNETEGLMKFESINDIIEGDKFDSIFLGCSTLKDPASSNGAYHNFEIVTFVDNTFFKDFETETEEYLQIKEKITKKLLNNLEEILPGAQENIVQVELGTPTTNKFYLNSTNGNVYGVAKTLSQMGPGSFTIKSEFSNLYLCGSSTMSHGVAGATNTGVMVAASLLNTTMENLLSNQDNASITIYEAEDPSTWSEEIKKKIEVRKARFEDFKKKQANQNDDIKEFFPTLNAS